jgi:hypothetical protein
LGRYLCTMCVCCPLWNHSLHPQCQHLHVTPVRGGTDSSRKCSYRVLATLPCATFIDLRCIVYRSNHGAHYALLYAEGSNKKSC